MISFVYPAHLLCRGLKFEHFYDCFKQILRIVYQPMCDVKTRQVGACPNSKSKDRRRPGIEPGIKVVICSEFFET